MKRARLMLQRGEMTGPAVEKKKINSFPLSKIPCEGAVGRPGGWVLAAGQRGAQSPRHMGQIAAAVRPLHRQ